MNQTSSIDLVPTSTTFSPLSIENQITLEILRQTRKTFDQSYNSFRLALLMTTISAIISLGGMGLLIMNRSSEGTITTATGLVTTAGFLKLTKEADDRLNKINERLDKLINLSSS